MIPRIVHQICFDGEAGLSESDRFCVSSTKRVYDGWEYRMWNWHELDAHEYFGDPVLRDILGNIRKYVRYVHGDRNYRALCSDILRCKLIAEFGGAYFDTDMHNVKQMDVKLLDEYDDLVCGIPYPYGAGGIDGLETSALFGCKGSVLHDTAYRRAVQNVYEFDRNNTGERFNLVVLSGPGNFTEAYRAVKDTLKERVYDLPDKAYYPYQFDQMASYNTVMRRGGKFDSDVYGIHRWSGSWRV